ncbi:MAG: proline--tRNA ligase [Chloroflexota bacterium]|nr:proline--tRNA ligase [Chloroflexota bacterium]
MRLSRLFGKTMRQTPSEADNVSHQLLLRAGMIHQVVAGAYSYLPLGWRALRKVENTVREEMDRIGGQELHMSVLQPLEIWQETGRDQALGKVLFTLSDRRDRKLVLGPTHEEVITELVRRQVQSYRDLPLLLYQIQTKFRDEPRPRGGLMRVREFTMKDMYSFDTDEDAMDVSYAKVVEAYERICQRCGLPTLMVDADSGAIGGKESNEFMLLADSGDDDILYCSNCGYAANLEKAESVKPSMEREDELAVEEVDTPGMVTIEDLANYLGVPRSKTLKAVFYAADGEVVFVVIRGDIDVNEVKLMNALKCHELRLATDDEVREAGLVAGAASPMGITGMRRVGDPSITDGCNFVAGANKPDTHVKNVNYPRDFAVDLMVDIAAARAGDGCPRCHGELRSTRGIEVGHVFKLGTFYSERLGATFLDQDGVERPIQMGCYGIGIGRLLAAAIEQNHDDKGIIWPVPIAPYHIHLCSLSSDSGEVASAAEQLYVRLQECGFEVLFDDRAESPGVKLNDADLLGMPVRAIVSPRSLKSQGVEVKRRTESEAAVVPLDGVVERLQTLLTA